MATRQLSIFRKALAATAVALALLVRLLPLPVSRRLGRGLGSLGYHFVPRLKRIGKANLDHAYGDAISPEEKRRILKESAQNMTVVAVEFMHIPAIDRRFVDTQIEMAGLEHVDSSRGALLVGAHYGNWEWMAPALVAQGWRLAEVVRPMEPAWMHRFVDRTRRGNGVHTIERDGAGREMLRLMREGWLVGVLIDQSPRASAAPVRFFDQPCWSTVAPAIAAARAQVPVHGIRMLRLEGAARQYRLEITPPIPMEHTDNLRTDLITNSQRCQELIERWVRECPGQWLWFHQRWRERKALRDKWEAGLSRQQTARPGPLQQK